MSEGPWKRGWKDWWSAGRAWFVRALGMAGIGALVAYSLGPRMLGHYPPWVGGLVAGGGAALIWGALTLVFSLLRAPGKAIKEKDAAIESANARIQELEATRPCLSACLHEDGSKLLLSVTNAGEPATVWATLKVSGNTLHQQSSVSAVWKHTSEDRWRLTTHETRSFTIAERKREEQHWAELKFYWFVPFIENGERSETRPLEASLPSYPGHDSKLDSQARAIRQDVSISVFSDPASLDLPIRCTLSLVGCDIWENLSGVPVCPQSQPVLSLENERFPINERTEFTSEGLAWKTTSGLVKGRFGEKFVASVTITPDQSAMGGHLPQPLTLRIQCSREPRGVSATVYEDSHDMRANRQLPVRANLIAVKGKIVTIELLEPQLKSPAMLLVTLRGHSQEEIVVGRIERQVWE